ncbi:MAG TPA: type I secretion system permease/ATPase [Gammaproteobacteria bacterium]|nr:type I secretion system permease/ATPase [Gammaproteobacteria bacterium]
MSSEQHNTARSDDWEVPREAVRSFHDPLLESLVLLARLEGRPATPDALTAGLPLKDGYLTPELFPRAAQRAGLSARLMKRPLDQIPEAVLPVVLLCRDRQACILTRIDRAAGRAEVIRPETGSGSVELAIEDLQAEYGGYVFFVKPEHRFDERAPNQALVRSGHWFWGTLARSWRIYRDVLVASLLINLFALASPLFVKNVYDRVVPNNATETLWVLAIGVALVVVFDILMKMLRSYFIDLAGKKADLLLSARIFEQVLGMRMEAKPPSVGAFANNLREFESIRDFITSASIATLVDLPFVFLFLLVIWLVGGPVVWVAIGVIVLVLIYGLLVQRPLRESVEKTYAASAQKGAMLVETLSGLESVKFLGAESTLQRKWEQLTGHIADWSIRSRLLSTSAVNVAGMLQQLSQVGVVVVGVYQIVNGELSMGGLIACTMLTGRAVAPMGQVANLAVRYFHAKTALGTLDRVMAMPVDRPEDKTFISRPALEGEIEFEHVSFKYPGQEMAALDDVSFRIRPGEHVGIIGRIGSGKSTIAKLILGLYAPASGAVRIDGLDVRQINPADLRRNIGYVAQEPVLFFGSVRENIVMAAPHASDEEILRAAEIAGVTDFVQRHPMGFDMPVGERGENLSGGQRQAIAVARALINAPGVFVMDEPTNSMDNTSESMLKKRLASVIEGKTAIIATHRSSILDLVDRLIVLDQGRVIADGDKETVVRMLKEGRLRTG